MSTLIFAHFSPNKSIDPASHQVLKCVSSIFERIIVVSTSYLGDEELSDVNNAELINRPNIGYDFYSYRVGLARIQDIGIDGREVVVLANSSFFLTDDSCFLASMDRLLKYANQYHLAGFVASQQIRPHLQSFLLAFTLDLKSESKLIFDFFLRIQPQNTKMELIQKYEVGLGEYCQKNRLDVVALTGSGVGLEQAWKRSQSWDIGIANDSPGKKKRGNTFLRNSSNPSLTQAEQVSSDVGIIKKEVIRANPAGISLNFLDQGQQEIFTRSLGDTHANSDHYRWHESGVYQYHTAAIAKAVVGPFWGPMKNATNVAVIAHVFYIDLLPEIIDLTANIVVPFDFIITTPHEADVPLILEMLKDIGGSKTIILVENKGRDIGPFVECYRNGLLENYQAVLKLHTKKSKYSDQGGNWRKSLYSGLCGNSGRVLKVIGRLQASGTGIVGPHEYFLTNSKFWGSNKTAVRNILEASGVKDIETSMRLGFFGGSMFWFNPLAFTALKKLDGEVIKFPDENGAVDGTPAHAIERLLCQLAVEKGFTIESNLYIGSSIYEFDSAENGVPVL